MDNNFTVADGVLLKYSGSDDEVVIPDDITVIGKGAFSECHSLSRVSISDAVTSIEASAFYNCGHLVAVAGCAGVVSIGNSAFSSCCNLESVSIPEGVVTIGERAFSDCLQLASVSIPESVTSIGDSAFEECGNLASVSICSKSISLGEHVFEGCMKLNRLYAPNIPIMRLGWEERKAAVLGIIDHADGATSAVLPAVSDARWAEVLRWCRGNLKAVLNRPDDTPILCLLMREHLLSAEEIQWCLEEVSADERPELHALLTEYACDARNFAAAANSPYTDFHVENGVLLAYYGCAEYVTIPAGVTSVGDFAFYNCLDMTSVSIADGVVSIGKSAFRNCVNLRSVFIPENVTSIGESAFQDCWSLTSVLMPDGVEFIGGYAFSGCGQLRSVSLPKSMTSVENALLFDCSSLASVFIPDGVQSIGELAFSSCHALTWVFIPDSVSSIGDSAFASCSSLAFVSFPQSITSVGEDAFRMCKSMLLLDAPGIPIPNLPPKVRRAAARSIIYRRRNKKPVSNARWKETLDWCRWHWHKIFIDMDFLPLLVRWKFIPKSCIPWCLNTASRLGKTEVNRILIEYIFH